MSKKAATTEKLGSLHNQVASVMGRVLDHYEGHLDALSGTESESEEPVLFIEPSAPFLSAVTKFLKDNEISCDDGAVDSLSETRRRLEDKKRARGQVVLLSDISARDSG